MAFQTLSTAASTRSPAVHEEDGRWPQPACMHDVLDRCYGSGHTSGGDDRENLESAPGAGPSGVPAHVDVGSPRRGDDGAEAGPVPRARLGGHFPTAVHSGAADSSPRVLLGFVPDPCSALGSRSGSQDDRARTDVLSAASSSVDRPPACHAPPPVHSEAFNALTGELLGRISREGGSQPWLQSLLHASQGVLEALPLEEVVHRGARLLADARRPAAAAAATTGAGAGVSPCGHASGRSATAATAPGGTTPRAGAGPRGC